MKRVIDKVLQAHLKTFSALSSDTEFQNRVEDAVNLCINALRNGGKILFCGNGGSAADAQHLAAELSGRFYHDREPLFAEALHVNTSYITAVANDYAYDQIYSRAIKAKGKEGDVIIGLSTSGNSKNVLNAFTEARKRKMHTIAFTGQSGGKINDKCNVLFKVPSDDTPRIQEMHILIGHLICELIEKELFTQ